MKLIAVLFTGHVGSSWLTSLLGSHSRIAQVGFEPVDELTALGIDAAAHFEDFLERQDGRSLPGEVRRIFEKEFEKDSKTAPVVWNPGVFERLDWLVFKARVDLQNQPRFFSRTVPERVSLPLLLRRRNKIKNAISQFKRTQLNISHLEGFGDTAVKRQPVRIDPDYILAQAGRFVRRELIARHYFCLLRNIFGLAGEELFYEDLLSPGPRDRCLEALVGRLGLAPEPLHSRYRKMTADALEASVENVAELRAAVAATPFARYLDDDDWDIVAEYHEDSKRIDALGLGRDFERMRRLLAEGE